MGTYRLSDEAKADLARIYFHGLRHYGEAQADRYYNAFFERFNELVDRPFMYPAVSEIREGYRRSICGVDSIYYRVVGEDVQIMAIVGRQDVDHWVEAKTQ